MPKTGSSEPQNTASPIIRALSVPEVTEGGTVEAL